MRSEGEWSCPPLRGEEAWRVKRKKGRERKRTPTFITIHLQPLKRALKNQRERRRKLERESLRKRGLRLES